MTLIPARIKDEQFIAEVEHFNNDAHDFHLWWLGQSGYLISWKGKRILIDPYLSDSLTKKYATTKKPHIRVSERVVRPELLKGISVVISSHNHTDHLDAETLIPIIKNNPEIILIIPEANRDFVCDRIRVPKKFPVGLNDGKKITIGEFVLHGLPAKHNAIERDENGNSRFIGYVIQFGNWSIYHSGDTLLFDEMVALLEPFAVDIAILPINGNDPGRGVAGNLNPEEAAQLGKAIGARLVIPCHYDMFSFNTADPNDFSGEAKKIGQPYYIMEIGEHFSSSFFTS